MHVRSLSFLVLVSVLLASTVLLSACGNSSPQETMTTTMSSESSPATSGQSGSTATTQTLPGTLGGTTTSDGETAAADGGEGATAYEVGESFAVGDLSFTVTGGEQLEQVVNVLSETDVALPENGAFFVATLEFAGKEGLSGGLDIATVKLRDSAGTLYEEDEPSEAADNYRLAREGYDNLSMAELGNVQTVQLFAIYDVPADAGPFTLVFFQTEDGKAVEVAEVSLAE